MGNQGKYKLNICPPRNKEWEQYRKSPRQRKKKKREGKVRDLSTQNEEKDT